MKNVILLVSFTCSVMSFSQQDPIFSGEGHNTFMHNPASYGNNEYWSVNAGARLQWVGLSSAPSVFYANGGVEIPIGSKFKNVKNFGLTLGTSYQYEEIWFQRNHRWDFAIGVPIYVTRQLSINLAAAPGIYSIWNDTKFDLAAGFMVNWKTLYAGFSITHLTAPFIGGFQLARHYHLQAGYKIPVKEHFIFPMLQMKAVQGAFVAQTMAYYVFKNDLFSIGAGWRIRSAVLFGAAVQFQGFRLGYNYDLDLSPLSNSNMGSHEVRLSYIFQPKKLDHVMPESF